VEQQHHHHTVDLEKPDLRERVWGGQHDQVSDVVDARNLEVVVDVGLDQLWYRRSEKGRIRC
jgi:hypothetical protein